ncbi:MAG: hypothetical protein WBN11_05750 [Eudoraea sp.]|uniref:hypothetical protein n=1 Tax=Eudoraea sp. TaxID=1979955 RepID=UPI003C779B4E
MRKKLSTILILLVLLISCNTSDNKNDSEVNNNGLVKRDLDAIIKDGKLRAILA